MADGDELDDCEYESIYGREMMLGRFTARVAALERKFAEQAARPFRLVDPPPPSDAELPPHRA